MFGYDHHFWGGGFWMIFIWIVPAAVMVYLIWMIYKRKRSPDRPNRALEILKRRYAAGEIDRDEFYRKKKEILSATLTEDQ